MQQHSKQGDTKQGDAEATTPGPVAFELSRRAPVDRYTVQALLSMLQSHQIDTQREAGSALVALAFHPWHRSTLRDLNVPDRAQNVLHQTTDREVKRLMSVLLRHMTRPQPVYSTFPRSAGP
jgi:hypothetical protein